MKYFFLAYAIFAALFIGLMPVRGAKSAKPPLRLFPDMDEQDVLKAQKPDPFFADGHGARLPVAGTQPVGLNPTASKESGGIHDYEFGGETGYYYTGSLDDYYANGMPEELGLTAENVGGFLRRGEEVFNINCAICHGKSGNGGGITGQFGVPGIADLSADAKHPETYPDGRIFEVISNGKGQMGSYKHNISVRDRWAVIAYIRALQTARKAPYEAVKASFDQAKAAGLVK